PLEQIEPHIRRLWKARLTDREIVQELQNCIDTTQYGIGLTKFVEIHNSLGLCRTRQQAHTPESIRAAMIELRAMYPKAGACEMVSLLFHERNLSVARRVVCEYFAMFEPGLIQQRKASRLQWRHFWAAGVNYIWAVDQHDKWLRFSLALHTGIEPFSGRILWMRVWHTNRNPQLILSYYIDTVWQLGFMPLVTQSDPCTENFGIANAQTMLQQMHDPALSGFVQHRWMCKKKNIMPEIAWSQLRCRFTPGFEALLEQGVEAGWYDIDNTLQLMVFRWLFILWLQQELDAYKDCVNNTQKRRDHNKVLPHGIPQLIHTSPEDYAALDFKVMVNPAALNDVHELYIQSTHPVFNLVPTVLANFIEDHYNLLNRPAVTRTSVWAVYRQLLGILQQQVAMPPLLASIKADFLDNSDEDVPLLLPGEDLPFHETGTHYYMGGVGGGRGLHESAMIV
ncbi:hypothetical protein PAXRUDRAFT_173806, partial [Paxillus rubicundulus Ve08.2h10]